MGLLLKVEFLIGGRFRSALHACAWDSKDEVARVLLEHGADVNIKSEFEPLCPVWQSKGN